MSGTRISGLWEPIAIALVVLISSVAASGKVIYVDDDASPGGDGLSWPTAYKCLQDALNAANSGDGIWVAAGIYYPSKEVGGSGSRYQTFQMINGVAIYGGFDSTETALGKRDIQNNETILSGDIGMPGENDDNCYHVFFHPSGTNLDATAILDGFTITAGNADGSEEHESGGGMYNYSHGNPIVTNCTFIGNSASWGGGMYNYNGRPTVTDCTFSGNTAGWEGGGMYNKNNGNPTVTDCIFSGNSAKYGGGIYNDWSSPMVTRCTFSGHSVYFGGGICNYNKSNPTVTNCTFTGNLANGGGGMSNTQSSPMVTNCTFSGNSVYDEGGGMRNYNSGSPSLTNCTFSGNSAYDGGGMFNYNNSSPTVTSCTFSGNSVGNNGGGMYNYRHSDSAITNCTFANNSGSCGGGIYNSIGYPKITNCILWGNTALSYSQIAGSGAVVTYSNIQGGSSGEGNIDSDPLFADINGSDNIMGTVDDNLRLLPGSPCIDAGDNTAVPLSVITDMDSNDRFVDDPDTTDTGNGTPPIVDMGAYEGPKQAFWLNPESVVVPEGETATFTVILRMDPRETVEVTVTVDSGDPDITVTSGAMLIFNSSNYADPQTVTLAAGEDSDYFHGTTHIRITATGISTAGVTATEKDNNAPPERLYVDKNAAGANDGTSWPDAFVELREALPVAEVFPEVREIFVAQGIYTPVHAKGSREETFQLVNNVAIYGGFPTGGSELEDRDPNLYESVLSGDLNGDDVGGWYDTSKENNSFHVVSDNGTDPNALINGFTITSGNANMGRLLGGGGIYWYDGTLTVIDCIFTRNDSPQGGGMYNDDGNVTLINCTFSNNRGFIGGGGMANSSGRATLTNCSFSQNLAIDMAGGGGLYNNIGSVTLTNCTFVENETLEHQFGGGGMYNRGSASLTLCTFLNNSAKEGGSGGGLYSIAENEVILSGCVFSGNLADDDGGGMYGYDGTLTNCVFTGNSGKRYGGGLYGSGTLTNCTFTGNSAAFGGGIYGWWDTLTNCTFTGNSAKRSGGGVYSFASNERNITNCTFTNNSAGRYGGGFHTDADLQVINCIYWNNTAMLGGNEMSLNGYWEEDWDEETEWFVPAKVTVSYSDVQGGSTEVYLEENVCILNWGAGNIDADPCFIESGYWDANGVWIDGDYHLQAGSPCIDAGDNTALPVDIADLDGDGDVNEPIPWDMDGNPRIVDGNTDGNAVVDMGAYEFFVPPVEVALRLTPQALNCRSKGNWVKAHLVLPDGYVVADVDADRPAVLHSFGIESAYMNVFVNKDKLVEIEAAFERQAVCSLTGDWPQELTVAGFLADGNIFLGTSTVRIIHPGMKVIEELAWYWLNADCVHPDFCNGIDMNRDSLVNLLDYALLLNSQVEFVTDE